MITPNGADNNELDVITTERDVMGDSLAQFPPIGRLLGSN